MHIDDPGRVGCLHLYIEHWGRGWVGMPPILQNEYFFPLGFLIAQT